jgi:hypothetical protein
MVEADGTFRCSGRHQTTSRHGHRLRNAIQWIERTADDGIEGELHRMGLRHRPCEMEGLLAETAIFPRETLMVTSNPTFGDIEGSAAIGMPSQVIRHGYPNTIIELAEMLKT